MPAKPNLAKQIEERLMMLSLPESKEVMKQASIFAWSKHSGYENDMRDAARRIAGILAGKNKKGR